MIQRFSEHVKREGIPSPDGLNGREGDVRIAREHVRKVALNEVLEEKLEAYLSLFEDQTLRAAFSPRSSRFSGEQGVTSNIPNLDAQDRGGARPCTIILSSVSLHGRLRRTSISAQRARNTGATGHSTGMLLTSKLTAKTVEKRAQRQTSVNKKAESQKRQAAQQAPHKPLDETT